MGYVGKLWEKVLICGFFFKVGKTVLLVALQSGCAKSVGIELSRTRYEICLEAYEKLTTDPLVKAQIEKDLAIAQSMKIPRIFPFFLL